MQGKELINDMIYTYFMLVTMIVGVMAVLGTFFIPDARFGYEAFVNPLIYAAWGTLPNVVMYAKKELTLKQFLVRKLIQLILVEIIVILVAIPSEVRETKIVAALGLGILLVYILTHIIEWFQNYSMAKRMTEELLAFQRKYE